MRWVGLLVQLLFFLSALLVVLCGWARWLLGAKGKSSDRNRRLVVAAGLGAALVSAACQVGVVFYLKKEHLLYWEESLVASAWGKYNLPLSVVALMCGFIGKGSGRWFLVVSGAWLVVVWTTAFIR